MDSRPDAPKPPDPRSQASRDNHSGVGLAGAGVVALMIVCCLGPILLATGALAAVGAFLANGWVIVAAALVAAGAVVLWLRHRAAGHRDCRPPPHARPGA